VRLNPNSSAIDNNLQKRRFASRHKLNFNTKIQKTKNETINFALKKALLCNNIKTVANISSKILNVPRKARNTISILGITNADGNIFVGQDSSHLIMDYYGNLFNRKTNIEFENKPYKKPIEYDEKIFEIAFLKLGRKKL